ncbi:glycoside hydrolase family 15 protein [Adhaeribacter pallidiroseus]|uniref:Glucan 1,4-alpha-glucosidase n=1 Tax=Adhaeribacter pallidiroseus TaxID=2072847 RepID=A0A369QFW7_9BACT|nr:glycoside hydrolase family 15 protein [Adhaeribacter pallidiroseus]RDC63322.1 Glucan 1,4-alpha-glucosidase [Adhaeribacter pallidiroseus]
MQHQNRPNEPIENYGIIGNLKTVALVSTKGSIDFMAFPRFDSPTVFASLLDANQGGYFSIEPLMGDFTNKQLYLPGTAILLTRFFSDNGIAEIMDYMPLPGDQDLEGSTIVRKVKAVRGNLTFRLHCAPRFYYAAATHTCTLNNNQITFTTAPDSAIQLRLLADVPLQVTGADGYAEFTVKETEIVHFVLESVSAGKASSITDIAQYTQDTYQQALGFWRNWLSKSSYKGRWSELIHRSAITLKLLTSSQFGSVIAAATFGLPETIGGNRNWDYRYTWIRDAAFTMYAFLRLGLNEEATNFLTWIFKQCQGNKLQLIYGVDGTTDLEEKELPHLAGYKNSKPVRIGNGAMSQLQIDIYGELIDTIYIYNKSYKPITYAFWNIVTQMVEAVIQQWQLPDHGIWEIRNEKKEFLHTRLMCWVALDRAIKIAESRSFPFPVTEWTEGRNAIYLDIYHNFWNDEIKAWVQYKGAQVVDASVLLMPLVHFISPLEPRWVSTLAVIDDRLRLDVLIYRYQNSFEKVDGLDGEEGTFNMCSFWYIEALAKSGQVDRAVENFEKMLGYANHLGLFSEELGKKGEHLGNFPQAFTHLALISAAMELNKQLDRIYS